MSSQTNNLTNIQKEANFLRQSHALQINDTVVSEIYHQAEAIARRVVSHRAKPGLDWDERLDNILTSRIWGFPSMLLLLGMVFWLTVAGANYPSQLIAAVLFWGQDRLWDLLNWLQAPHWLISFGVEGVYRCLAWVISVMLPPMAIFFPCFTLLEDLGYLPRVAFNLDRFFKSVGAHGKQALTMSMGFGCNAAGVVACRIIESPRERLIAMLTNNFVPCNGRFPTLIALAGCLVFGLGSSLATTAVVVGVVLFGIAVTLGVSWLLSRTLLKGVPSSFTLELPPTENRKLARL
ncbi:hypothetical protein JCM39194_15740 [Desulfotomaculum varum]